MKNLTSKNKENYHSNILSNGLRDNNNNYINNNHNNTNHVNNNNNTIDKQIMNNHANAKSPPRKNLDDAENHNLNIKLEDLIKHLHLFEILLEMELVY